MLLVVYDDVAVHRILELTITRVTVRRFCLSDVTTKVGAHQICSACLIQVATADISVNCSTYIVVKSSFSFTLMSPET